MCSVLPARTRTGEARCFGLVSGCGRKSSKKRAFALIVAGLAAGTVAAAGGAAAESLSGSDHSGRSGSRDSTGWHAIDPFGYQHSDPNPLRQNEHQHALREYHRRNKPGPDESSAGNGAGKSAWTRTQRPDGDGWTVCRPQAKWC
ncbi:hypothetical protein [Nocardia sp. NPDC047654]|uniref:hypothetical protein n=1 Tax=Nocardia sp. NPDC047654 TaxID=3364314 RepID=UPI00371017C8